MLAGGPIEYISRYILCTSSLFFPFISGSTPYDVKREQQVMMKIHISCPPYLLVNKYYFAPTNKKAPPRIILISAYFNARLTLSLSKKAFFYRQPAGRRRNCWVPTPISKRARMTSFFLKRVFFYKLRALFAVLERHPWRTNFELPCSISSLFHLANWQSVACVKKTFLPWAAAGAQIWVSERAKHTWPWG